MDRSHSIFATLLRLAAVLGVLLLGGCYGLIERGNPRPLNPSFAITYQQGRAELAAAAAHPHLLDRPLVLVGGFLDPGVAPAVLSHRFADWTRGRRIIGVSLGFCFSFDQCRRRIVEAVQAACPSDDPTWTVPVDVVGVSMGGLAARVAASPMSDVPRLHRAPLRRLNIVRLFTISSPLRGAVLAERMPAWLETLDPITLEMRPGSALLTQLDQGAVNYPIFSYVRLRDQQVGTAYAAAAGQSPWWVPVPPLASTHADAFVDPRILADIVRRLTDQSPLSSDPPAPLPRVERLARSDNPVD